jgi:hypothetical protein
MATKKNKTVKFNLKRLLSDKRVLIAIGLGVSLFVVLGLSTFAATNQKLPTYTKSFTSCRAIELTFGSKQRDCVKYVQDRLNYACSNNLFSTSRDLKVDGGFGESTRNKISGFQRSAKIKPVTGRVNRATWDKLSFYYGGGSKPKDTLSCR